MAYINWAPNSSGNISIKKQTRSGLLWFRQTIPQGSYILQVNVLNHKNALWFEERFDEQGMSQLDCKFLSCLWIDQTINSLRPTDIPPTFWLSSKLSRQVGDVAQEDSWGQAVLGQKNFCQRNWHIIMVCSCVFAAVDLKRQTASGRVEP